MIEITILSVKTEDWSIPDVLVRFNYSVESDRSSYYFKKVTSWRGEQSEKSPDTPSSPGPAPVQNINGLFELP
jgi:hypothetical protein